MGDANKPGNQQNNAETSAQISQRRGAGQLKNSAESREQKLARQLRENLAKRKNQSRARNTKPRKFKNKST